jgi:hypothetical protein
MAAAVAAAAGSRGCCQLLPQQGLTGNLGCFPHLQQAAAWDWRGNPATLIFNSNSSSYSSSKTTTVVSMAGTPAWGLHLCLLQERVYLQLLSCMKM